MLFANVTGLAKLRASLANITSRLAASGKGGEGFAPFSGSIEAITSATVAKRGLANASSATRSTRARISS